MDNAIKQLRRLVDARTPTELPIDGQLLEAFLTRRDEAAFAELVQRHGGMVFGVCRRILGEEDLAEDAFQATFVVLARRAASLRRQGPIGGWLHGVAYRTALKARTTMHKRRLRERRLEPFPEPAVPAAEPGNDWKVILDQELDALPVEQRLVLVVCDLEGRSLREAARHLKVPASTLSDRLVAARKKLAVRLLRRGVTLTVSGLAAALAQEAAAAVPSSFLQAAVRAALAGASASGSSALLAEGVLRAMLYTKLKAVCGAVLALGLLGLGAAWQARALGGAGGGDDADQPAPHEPALVAAAQEGVTQKSALKDAVRAAKEYKVTGDAGLREKVNLLVSLANQQGRAGDRAGAGVTFAEALAVAKNIADDDARAEAQSHIGFYQAHAGLVREAAETADNIAIKEGKLKGDALKHRVEHFQGWVRKEIASHLAKEGKYDEALAAAATVPVSVRRFKDKEGKVIERREVGLRDFAYTHIVEAQLKAGKTDEALKTIRKIEARPGTIYLLADIVRAQGARADRAAARRLLDDFKKELDKADLSPSTRYATLADVQAALGDVAGALAWIEKLEAPELEAQALAGLSMGLSRIERKRTR